MDSDKDKHLFKRPPKRRKSSESNESLSSFGSFGQINDYEFVKIFDERYENIIDRQEVETNKLIDNLLEAPIDLKKRIYKELVADIKRSRFPNKYSSERRHEEIINIFVKEVYSYLNNKEKTYEKTVEFHYQKRFELTWEVCRHDLGMQDKDAAKLKKLISKGSADVVLKVDTNESKGLIYFLAVEVKKDAYESGIIQCILYLVACYYSNQDKKPVFGICSDGDSCNLIKYDGNIKELKMRSTFMIIFPKMVDENYEQKWIDEYSHLADIIYSIFKIYFN